MIYLVFLKNLLIFLIIVLFSFSLSAGVNRTAAISKADEHISVIGRNLTALQSHPFIAYQDAKMALDNAIELLSERVLIREITKLLNIYAASSDRNIHEHIMPRKSDISTKQLQDFANALEIVAQSFDAWCNEAVAAAGERYEAHTRYLSAVSDRRLLLENQAMHTPEALDNVNMSLMDCLAISGWDVEHWTVRKG